MPRVHHILRLLDRALPVQVLDDPARKRPAQLLVGLILLATVVTCISALNYGLDGAWLEALRSLALVLFWLGLVVGHKRGMPRDWVVRLTFGVSLVYISWVLWNAGGVRAGVTAGFMMALPVASLAIQGPKSAFYWGLAVVLVFAAFGLAAEHPGLPSPPATGHASTTRMVVAEASLLFFFLAMAWFQYDLARLQRQELLLARKKADQATRAKSSFLANMSHELRTPMNGVLGLTQVMLADGNLEPDQADTLKAIRTSGQSLVALLNDILDFSKIEAGRLELELVPFSARQLVEQVYELLGEAARTKGLELRIDEEEIGWVMGDPTRIRQVLLNLVGNAIKFTSTGYIQARVTHEGQVLRFEIQDTGIGIPVNKQGQLWQPFTQADASTTRRFGGTGLGLAISRRLVERMGGEVDLVSSPGVGSCFGFTIQAQSCPAPVIEDVEPQSFQLSADMRVLVAEDNLVNQVVARRMLEQFGLLPVIVANGAEALERIRAESWDVVLMDCHMPVLDGLEATRIARDEGSVQYIVAMTAGTMPEDKQAAAAAGMDGFLSKPVRLTELKQLLQDLVSRQSAAS